MICIKLYSVQDSTYLRSIAHTSPFARRNYNFPRIIISSFYTAFWLSCNHLTDNPSHADIDSSPNRGRPCAPDPTPEKAPHIRGGCPSVSFSSEEREPSGHISTSRNRRFRCRRIPSVNRKDWAEHIYTYNFPAGCHNPLSSSLVIAGRSWSVIIGAVVVIVWFSRSFRNSSPRSRKLCARWEICTTRIQGIAGFGCCGGVEILLLSLS